MNIKHGAVWEIPPEHKGCGLEEYQTGPGGSWDLRKMRREERFSELVEVLDNGLLCEVLSWSTHSDTECEKGPQLIATALNDPQGKGATTHEMERLNAMADFASSAAAGAKQDVTSKGPTSS
eukprot:6167226-Pyramimonas_sp.AAC.1